MSAYDNDDEGTVQAYGDSEDEPAESDVDATTASQSAAYGSNDEDSPVQQEDVDSSSEDDDVVVDDGKVDVIIKETDCEISPSIMMDWYDTTLENLGGDTQDNRDQLEFMACAFEDRCLGGTTDYSEQFKSIWGVTIPRCKAINDALSAGYISIDHEDWQEAMEGHFGCPMPTNQTATPTPTPAATQSKHSLCY